jgi:redox-sensitive bicupin YhaK (pirin superfamily)
VTIAYQGEIEHRDSSGGGGKIGAGDVQWMTAGNGIVHEEFHSQDFTRKGGTFQMVQLWVNLRAKGQERESGLSNLAQGADSKRGTAGKTPGTVRVIAGEYRRAQRRGEHFLTDQSVGRESPRRESVELPLPDGPHHYVSCVDRRSRGGRQKAGEGDLAIFARAATASL